MQSVKVMAGIVGAVVGLAIAALAAWAFGWFTPNSTRVAAEVMCERMVAGQVSNPGSILVVKATTRQSRSGLFETRMLVSHRAGGLLTQSEWVCQYDARLMLPVGLSRRN